MSEQNHHELVAQYLRQLDAAAIKANLPRTQRLRLKAEIAAHLSEAIQPGMSEATVAAVLNELGSPEEIVSEESASPNAAFPKSRSHGRALRVVLVILAVLAGASALIIMLPSAISYVTAPGLYFSAFVWLLGGSLAVVCIALSMAAKLRWKR